MDNIKIEVENNLKKYFKDISNKVTELAKKSKGRYFAYIVVSDTDTCRAEGWDWEIDYKSFDKEDGVKIHILKKYGYTVIDKLGLIE